MNIKKFEDVLFHLKAIEDLIGGDGYVINALRGTFHEFKKQVNTCLDGEIVAAYKRGELKCTS